MSAEVWEQANPPDYSANVDLEYPYSECPFLGEYYLYIFPKSGRVEHVSYWGEGRIEKNGRIGGFPNCYNINLTYQLVNGRKIPNRIPVVSKINCKTGSYINDNSVNIVTVMKTLDEKGNIEQISADCAKDIARIIQYKTGLVVTYDIDSTESITTLEKELQPKGLVYCPSFEFPEKLRGMNLFDSYRAYLNLQEYQELLYTKVTSAQFDNVIQLCQELSKSNYGSVVYQVVDKLLKEVNIKTMTFAYRLWFGGAQNIVIDHFPSEFKYILRSDNVKIINHKYKQALILDSHKTDDDRMGWGDSKDKTSARVSWKFIPLEMDNNVVFKIQNNEHTMFLKLDVNTDPYYGDRACWGSNNNDEKRHNWTLVPTLYKNLVLFFIINYEYKQGLKLDSHVDDYGYGDRSLWGNHSDVTSDPDYFGWIIEPHN